MEQMPSNTPIMESKPGPAGWIQVWIKAVTKPSEQTFVEITESPDMSSKTAYIWVFIVGTISGIAQAILRTIYSITGTSPLSAIPGLGQQLSHSGRNPGVTFIIILCFSPVIGLVTVLFFALGTAIVQWIAKLFGGVGTYDKLAYAFAAIAVPLAIVSIPLTLLSAIPYIGTCFAIVSLGLGIYGLVLRVMAVKGANRFGWGQAIGTVLIPFVVILVVCGCVAFGLLAVLGPVVKNVFEQINQNLSP